MSANTELRWLKPAELKGAARRFSEFCKADFKQQAKTDTQFDHATYEQAVKLILDKLTAPKTAVTDKSET